MVPPPGISGSPTQKICYETAMCSGTQKLFHTYFGRKIAYFCLFFAYFSMKNSCQMASRWLISAYSCLF